MIIVDTTPIIALSIAGEFEILRTLYGSVCVPGAVIEEVLAGGSRAPGYAEIGRRYVRRVAVRQPIPAVLAAGLDRGESEVLALALEHPRSLAVLDERLARAHARRLGVRCTGTLGILLHAKGLGHLAEIGPVVASMRRGGIFLSEAVVARTLELAGETGS